MKGIMKRTLALVMAMTLLMGMSITAQADTYTVQSGDVLWKIAEANNTTTEALIEMNDIKNANMIYPGQTLVVTEEEKAFKPGKNSVSFLSEGVKVAADLYLPESYVAGEKLPTIIVTPPITGVKEQTAGLYAEKMSKEGFAAMAFDPRGFGESEGELLVIDPHNAAEDIWNGVTYLKTLDMVDGDNVFALGICGGSAYSYYATALDNRISAVATVSPYLTLATDARDAFGGDGTSIRNLLYSNSGLARDGAAAYGQEILTKAVPETEEEIAAATPIALGMRTYYLEGMPGDVSTWKNSVNVKSVNLMNSFNIYDYAFFFDAIPVLTVVGDEAITTPGAVKFYDMINGPKEKLEIEGSDHFELYWKPEYVNPAVEKISAFYKSNMK